MNNVINRNLGYKTKAPSYLDIKEEKRTPHSPYMQGWTNFGTAGYIYTNPNTPLIDRYKSGIYLGAWGGAHLALVVGGAILIKETIVVSTTTCATNPSCVDRASQKIAETSQEVQKIVPKLTQGNLREGLEHIVYRHWFSSGFDGASKFNSDINLSGLKDLVSSSAGSVNQWTQQGTAFVRNFDAGRIIGSDKLGEATSVLRIVVNNIGEVITAYPVSH